MSALAGQVQLYQQHLPARTHGWQMIMMYLLAIAIALAQMKRGVRCEGTELWALVLGILTASERV